MSNRFGTRGIAVEAVKLRMRQRGLSVKDLVDLSVKLRRPISPRSASRLLGGGLASRPIRENLAFVLELPLDVVESGASDHYSPALLLHDDRSDDIGSCVQRSVAYLLATQNQDGGWGMEAKVRSDPHNTAEVIRGLQSTPLRDGVPVRRALQFLISTQDPGTGGWSSRLEFGDEQVTATATAACVHVLVDSSEIAAADLSARLGVHCLISMQRDSLWPNRRRAAASMHASALSLHALAYAHGGPAGHEIQRELFTAAVTSLEHLQNQDGGFPFSDGEKSSIAASLYIFRSLLCVSARDLAKTDALLSRLRKFIDDADPKCALPTEFQENDAIVGEGCQFEHFNVARLLLLARHGQLNPIWLAECSAHVASLMRPQGCRAHLNGRVYTWSTSQLLQALCCEPY